jgi:hypothetical protein
MAVWCPGTGMGFIDVPALESSDYKHTLSLVPLTPIPLAGRALPSSDGVSLANAELRLYYNAGWLCAYFNLADCLVPSWQIATGQIAADGSFRVMVPDFAADRAMARWAQSRP